MNLLSSKVKPFCCFSPSLKLLPFCTHSLSLAFDNNLIQTPKPPATAAAARGSVAKNAVKISDAAALKEGWLDSLSCPFPDKSRFEEDTTRSNAGSNWVIGIDPDLSGALALLKTDDSGCSAQVFDSPNLLVRVGKRVRKRLDARSIVQMVQSLEAPVGTTAFIEQSIPFPQDGKQGWWSGGFGYGLWIGILVASGFSVVPVPSSTWKKEFELTGSRCSKDDSRRAASTLFPSLCDLLKRKMDHGRAEALLIAAYGNGMKLESSAALEELVP
ncbi:hypothetical protein SLEP1_g7074 [Rubroshorea leprosula]|uniref:Uncharacterized protein n=1 Tax=Rubroshorea leprosula TaxID=152421 RepID=A0AAV5I6G4_9ROSI|nr:hypothetical protein SLEP1_g7074 [Rubroshorea leprosula]